MTDPYSGSYQEARRAFREAGKRIGAQLEAHVVQTGFGPDDNLTIDAALVGAANPLWSLVVSSGLHGVEGFFGSATQVAHLSDVSKGDLVDARGQLVFLHALNPFGFANLRRVNEDNVDLNRNFLLRNEPYQSESAAYAKLDPFLNPEGPPQRFDCYLARVLWRIARVGLPTLKQVVAEGQFAFPKGIFFGGHKATRSTQIVQENIMRWVQGRYVVHLDLHSGLGAYAKYKLLVTTPLNCNELARYRELYGPEVEIAGGQGIAYKTKGDLGRYMAATAKQLDYHFLFVEFGTHSSIRVLGALRRENQAHFFTPEDSYARQRSKAELLECFFPSSSSWRRPVLERGLAIIQRAQRAAALLANR